MALAKKVGSANLYKYHLDKEPKGTPEQLKESMEKILKHQLSLIDYSDNEEFPDHILEEQKRLVHYAVRGPRRGYMVAYPKGKLWQADVLFILTTTKPTTYLAKKFNVNVDLIRRIRRGQESQWQYEYLLIKRLKTAIRHNLKQLHNNGEPIVYSIRSKTGEILNLVTSNRKAKEYMEALYKKDLGCYIVREEVLR